MFLALLFFKQKTAYEMRISDWSSDVCSSDLTVCLAVMRICFHQLVALDLHDDTIVHHLEERLVQCFACAELVLVEAGHARHAHLQIVARNEIGRASCRERVCQYV